MKEPTHIAAHMQLLMDHIPSMLAYWDQDLRCRFANEAYKTWFGVSPEQILGCHMAELLGPQLFELNTPYIQGALKGESQSFERPILRPDGQLRHSLSHYIPHTVEGCVQGFMAYITDVTPLKHAEAELKSAKAFQDRTARLASVGGWEFDLRTQSVYWSDEVCRIHGLPTGSHPSAEAALSFIAPESRQAAEQALRRSIQTNAPWDIELPLIRPDGNTVWTRSFGEIEMEDGCPVKLVGAVQDITEQRQRDKALQQEQLRRHHAEVQLKELARLLEERSEMLDILAHEVRQPLNNASAALQSAKAALNEADTFAAATRLTRTETVMAHVVASIDNTLAVAALLARSAPILRQSTDVDTLIAMAVADMPSSERKRIRVVQTCTEQTVPVDPSLMRLAIRNLLANALKFSPPDSDVHVAIHEESNGLALHIDVSNEGPGVPADLLPRLFQRGAHGPMTASHIGHGLGLYIARRVMELHEGHIRLTANTPNTTTFRLTLQTP